MSNKKSNSLTWLVTYYNCNMGVIEYYNILKHRERLIRKFKRECGTKREFSEKMRREMMYCFWSKCEWELIIEVDDECRVWLTPLVGYKGNDVRVDVTDRTDFDWKSFSDKHIGRQTYKNKAKIDVFDQIEWRWSEFINYCWYTRLKYERDNPKYHETACEKI